VDKPSGNKVVSNTREALMVAMDQVKILLENLHMMDPSVIFLPYKAKYRGGVELDMISTEEHVHDNCDFMRKYLPQFYVHRYDTYMYSHVIMAFNTPQEDFLRESSNILYGDHQAMHPRDLEVKNCVIMGFFLYSHIDVKGKRFMKLVSHLSGYQMTAQWKTVDAKQEERKERLRLWRVESGEKDKNQVTRYLESMYHMNHRKLFPLGCKLRFLFDLKESIGIHGRDKTQKIMDQQVYFIKIHRSVQVPGVKEV
jgi:hypothetical protein